MVNDEEQYERFMEILRDGGSLVAHPDTLAELKRAMCLENASVELFALAYLTAVIPNQYVEPGTLLAVEKKKESMPPFSFRPEWFDSISDATFTDSIRETVRRNAAMILRSMGTDSA